jgi:hypothetical protein
VNANAGIGGAVAVGRHAGIVVTDLESLWDLVTHRYPASVIDK